MIVTDLNGGLGNQMFQYAAARALAVRNNSQVYRNVDAYSNHEDRDGYTRRNYELHIFNTEAPIAGFRIRELFGSLNSGLYPTVTETNFSFDPTVPHIRGNAWLQGYWQSEKYFAEHQQTIRNDFTFRASTSPETQRIANEISELGETISIHIRRGDYATSVVTNAFHGLIPVEWYSKAVSLTDSRLTHAHYFVFSDDAVWASENLIFLTPKVTFVKHNKGEDSWQDMYLMSLCKHNIIANSSFSWWGAWLNNNNGKMVIAPRQWFADEKMNAQTGDLIPEKWERL